VPFKSLPYSYSPSFADNFEVRTKIKLKLSHKAFNSEEILVLTDLKEINVMVTGDAGHCQLASRDSVTHRQLIPGDVPPAACPIRTLPP